MASDALLELIEVGREYRSGGERVCVLDDLSLEVQPAERLAIMGSSGSGKSTLLSLAAGMDLPDRGQVWLDGTEINALAEPERTRFRARRIGLVFQDFNLIDSLSAYDNIALVPWLSRQRIERKAIKALCQRLGVEHLLERLPAQLSGGEQQRVAIARALIHRPDLLLADEPTGSLDQTSAERVLDLFDEVTQASGCAVVMVTHSQRAAARMDKTYRLEHGRLLAS